MEKLNVVHRVVNHVPAMLAYWGADQRCCFSNMAYREWFGRAPEEMEGITMERLLGPDLYRKNLPYIEKALAGEPQIFERQIPLPTGEIRESICTYTPEMVDGVVRGFIAHVTNVTRLRKREMVLHQAIAETIDILERTKRSFRSKELGVLRERLEELQRVVGP
jgi:PAS domain S-box-containing protein